MATVAQPKLLLLDEHTAALDPGTAEKVLNITRDVVAEHKITTMMVTRARFSSMVIWGAVPFMGSWNSRPSSRLRRYSGLKVMSSPSSTTLIIGETMFGRFSLGLRIFGVAVGSCIYRIIIAVALAANVPSTRA